MTVKGHRAEQPLQRHPWSHVPAPGASLHPHSRDPSPCGSPRCFPPQSASPGATVGPLSPGSCLAGTAATTTASSQRYRSRPRCWHRLARPGPAAPRAVCAEPPVLCLAGSPPAPEERHGHLQDTAELIPLLEEVVGKSVSDGSSADSPSHGWVMPWWSRQAAARRHNTARGCHGAPGTDPRQHSSKCRRFLC